MADDKDEKKPASKEVVKKAEEFFTMVEAVKNTDPIGPLE